MDGGGVGVVAPPALEKNAAELTVMDVYDIASAVGQEFERVIDQHGCEAIARLMPKVVRVLEILEVLVSRNHINPELEELRLELDRLRLERMDRIEKERKHQKVRGDTGGYGGIWGIRAPTAWGRAGRRLGEPHGDAASPAPGVWVCGCQRGVLIPSWKFPASFPSPSPSPVAAFPSQCVSLQVLLSPDCAASC